VKLEGLPSELQDLLERLHRRGLPVTPLEVARLRHLLGVEGTLCAAELPTLLDAVLCKDERHRTVLRREYPRWAADHERGFEPVAREQGADAKARPDASTPLPDIDRLGRGVEGGTARPRRINWRAIFTRYRWQAAATGAMLAMMIGLWTAYSPPEEAVQIPKAPLVGADHRKARLPDGAPCPQTLPTRPAPEVWAWVARPDYRPWLALGDGFLLLVITLAVAWRLLRADRRYLWGLRPSAAGDAAPRRGLAPMPIHGDLLLAPGERREMIWSIDRYVSEDPTRLLDLEATVNATARAAGEPHIVHEHLSFPRQVWLWCDQKSARPQLQQCLVDEVRKALDQANLPVRIARFHGLPSQLRWEDNREPFAPAFTEAAGAQAAVVVVSDGAALIRAWNSAGERPLLERVLRQLRAWPRLCLVDLGEEGELARLASLWRLEARTGEGLANWLAGRSADPGIPPAPDPAQLDLWAGAWLLANPGRDHACAQSLRQAMGLRLGPLDYTRLLARLQACEEDPALASRLVNRLARTQPLDERDRPKDDGYFTRALEFWEQRFRTSRDRLPEDDTESRGRLTVGLARLELWREPERAAENLARLDRGRNRAVIRRELAGLAPRQGPVSPGAGAGRDHRPTWDWKRLPRKVQFRLLSLGLQDLRPEQWGLRLGARHHLALALLAGAALGGVVWGTARFLLPQASDPLFDDPRFRTTVIQAHQGGRAWLGSPWHLTALPALGPFDTPYTWSWEGVPNRPEEGPRRGLFLSGTQAFPIRACGPRWPRRTLAVIQAPLDDDAKRLAIRLLDRGAADRVLVAPDWERRLPDLTQGLDLPDDQLLLFLPPQAPEAPSGLARRYGQLAEVRGDPAALAAALDFPGERAVDDAWPQARTRVLAGSPRVWGGPELWRDGKTGVTWVRICGGTFSMGSPESEDQYLAEYAKSWGTSRETVKRWLDRERPRHPVRVGDFWITRTELTRAQYRALGRKAKGAASLPVVDVDWQAASDACVDVPPPPVAGDEKWESKPQLPAEAQWEYAARAGSATRWSFGDDAAALGEYAWFQGNAQGQARPVGEKRPNGLCLADMHGNVAEWVRDCFAEKAYAARNPSLTLDPLIKGGSACKRRVVRGGSFGVPPGVLRSAVRGFGRPDFRLGALGLRCVRSRARQP
jgi:formylglycine-generating enzyme required for sulfatase activity